MRVFPNIYSQRDQAWDNDQLGTVSGATIGVVGCYLTVDAMLACYYGHQVRPDELNDLFTRQNIYVQGDLLTDDALSKVFPDCSYIQTYNYSNVAANLNLLQQLASDESTTVILELDFDHNPNDGIQTHFVCLHDYDGTTLTIYDPWWGTDSDFTLHYGTDPKTTILKYVVYHGNPVGQAVSVPSGDFTRLVFNSTQYDDTTAYLNLPKQSDGKDADFQEVKKVLDGWQQTIHDLQSEVQQGKDQTSTLAGEIQKIHETDSAAIQTGLDAEHQRDDLHMVLDIICQSLDLTTIPLTSDGKVDSKQITDLITQLKAPPPAPTKPSARKKLTFPDWVSLGWNLVMSWLGRRAP